MRGMLKRLLPLLFPLLAAAAHAGTCIWVRGVSPQSGWYDADKTLTNDHNLCWAATAANMVAWWQDRNAELCARTAAPRGVDAAWETLRQAFADCSGDTFFSLRWWFSGEMPPDKMPPTQFGRTQGGYCRDLLPAAAPFPERCLFVEEPKQGMSARLRELLEGGYAVGIGIRRLDKETRTQIQPVWHMLSLWGAEFDDETGLCTRVFLTDSDDIYGEWSKYQRGLFAAEVQTGTTVYEDGKPLEGFILKNRIGWFKGNATITTLVALHADTAVPTKPGAKEQESPAPSAAE